MTLSEELKWRGFINQTTYDDLKRLDGKKIAFYHGFDASANSQTVGNLAGMMLDLLFMRHGHTAIILAGGATSLIGDPGGKDVERPMQDEKTIAHNIAMAEQQLKKVFTGHKFTLVNNLDWTKNLTVIDFLRNVGKHFSMTPLVQRDYIAKRIGEGGTGISYTEFSYTLLQGMDYLHLFDKYGVTLQLGGSDQWGNLLSGVELIRKARGKEVHALTMPLIINKATGKKFGKSEEGAVWLDAEKTSVYKFYQFWLNVDDGGVEDYLKIYTELDKPAIDMLMEDFNNDKASRLAQKTLAYEVTKKVHGEKQAESVKRVSEALFGKGNYGDLKAEDFDVLKTELPVVKAKVAHDLIHVLVEAGLASSNSEARRFLEQKSVYVNGQQVEQDYQLTIEDRLSGHNGLIKRGKNSFAVIEIN
jgi:tyrosyl-tRNA synthetase